MARLPVLAVYGMFRAMLLRTLTLLTALLPAPLAAGPTTPAAPALFEMSPLADTSTERAVTVSARPVARRMTIPKARWGTSGGRTRWSMTVLSSLRGHAGNLPDIVPGDIETWCPAYPSAGREQREAFWLGLVSSLVKHESTFRPTAVGGGGLWYGLMQILPATARLYGCEARSGEALKNPQLNLACGMRIMARTVARDRVVSQNMRGVAADWGPFHSRKKREDMIAWTRAQDYCTGMASSLRPVARPDSLFAPLLMADGSVFRPEARPASVSVLSEAAVAALAVPRSRIMDGVIATSGHVDLDDNGDWDPVIK